MRDFERMSLSEELSGKFSSEGAKGRKLKNEKRGMKKLIPTFFWREELSGNVSRGSYGGNFQNLDVKRTQIYTD